MNFWDMKTVYKYQNKPISATQLCVPYVTKFISYKKSDNIPTKNPGNSQEKNVFYLGATTNFYPISKKELITYIDSRSSLPLSIHVPCYSHVEYLAACKLYFQSKIFDHGLTNQQLLAYRIHVSNNPRLTRKDATRFFMPIYSKYATAAFFNYVNCHQEDTSLGLEEGNLQEYSEDNEQYYGLSSVRRASDGEEGFEEFHDENVAATSTSAAGGDVGDHQNEGGGGGDYLEEENLFNLPEASLENDVDLTKFTEQEVDDFFEMIGEDEEIDELVADELPLPERDLGGKDIKRIDREDE
jgi:hypothetical protein